MIIQSNSAEETFRLGEKIGQEAQAGQVFCLYGDLGVGKTVFTQGLAKGLGIDDAEPDLYNRERIRGRQTAFLSF